jgi:hypothetical protein
MDLVPSGKTAAHSGDRKMLANGGKEPSRARPDICRKFVARLYCRSLDERKQYQAFWRTTKFMGSNANAALNG